MSVRHVESCPECGAAQKPGAEVCDLCGSPLYPEFEQEAEIAEEDELDLAPAAFSPAAEEGVFCNQCGWKNPAGSRFCSKCGSPLQVVAAAAPVLPRRPTALVAAPASTPEGNVGRKVGIIVSAAVLIVLALFLVTVASKGSKQAAGPAAPDSAGVAASHEELPLEPDLARQADSLQKVIDGLDGQQKLAVQSDLVGLFIQRRRIDRAALEQQKLAEATDTPEAWTRAGNLYFDWMETIDGEHKVEVSHLAIAAYQRVLEKQPDNLDVRTDMAWAYQYDPQNSMESIVQTNQVLEKNPNHWQANFNKGVFLIQINRLDQAQQQFEKTKSLAGPGTPELERAEAAIQAVKDMRARASS